MGLVISKGLTLRKGWQPMDPDAAAYITAVETADGQALEEKTKIAIDNFVLGCKADGIWNAIKASCILAGARTLNGALVPLVGAAPTLEGDTNGWSYTRKIGPLGNGTDNYIGTGRLNNADPQDSKHLAIWLTQRHFIAQRAYLGFAGNTDIPNGSSVIGTASNANSNRVAINSSVSVFASADNQITTGRFMGISRNNSSSVLYRSFNLTRAFDSTSISPSSSELVAINKTVARLAFYSIGESLDLALLDTRVTDLINAFAAAIP
jgi:hypothetical protein